MRLVIILATAFMSMASSNLVAKEPTDAELDDWFIYLRSIAIPATIEVCTPVLENKEAFIAAANGWLEANKTGIARGKEVAISGLPEGKTLDESNSSMVQKFVLQFNSETNAKKVARCLQYQDTYIKSTK